MRLKIPPKVQRILDALDAHGYEAYAVGGCIRDSILARTPNDWDITTSATPLEVKQIFQRTVDTGLQHGTVTVLFGEDSFEVTTYRVDGDYTDHRHPTEVIFSSNLREDLMRRDFTINAMAYNPREGLVDLFGGMQDLQKQVIRCVGNPRERFDEDALRILRAVRFSAQLGFSVEAKTVEALTELAPTLEHVSKERIQVELIKLLVSPNPDAIGQVQKLGILPVFLPELSEISAQTLEDLRILPADKALRLARLLLPLGEKAAGKVLRRLKFDNDTINRVRRLIRGYQEEIPETMEGMREALNRNGAEIFPDLLVFRSLAQDTVRLAALYQEVLEKKQCFCLAQLAITGNDLIALGMKPGEEIGRTLQACLALVIREPDKNEKEELLRFVREPGTEEGCGQTD